MSRQNDYSEMVRRAVKLGTQLINRDDPPSLFFPLMFLLVADHLNCYYRAANKYYTIQPTDITRTIIDRMERADVSQLDEATMFAFAGLSAQQMRPRSHAHSSSRLSASCVVASSFRPMPTLADP